MCSNGIPKRYILSILVFWGFFTMYALRTNLNVAIGAMVKNHTVFIDGVETDKVSQLLLTSFNPFKPKSDEKDFTLSNARRFTRQRETPWE